MGNDTKRNEKEIKLERMNFHYAFHVAYYEWLFDIMYFKEDSESDKDIANLNDELLSTQPKIQNETDSFVRDGNSFLLTTGYPGLLIGIGNQHESKLDGAKGEFELGFCLDYVTGMPYIPGSSVKGLLRSVFNQLRVKKCGEYITDIINGPDGKDNYDNFLESIEEYVFNGINEKDTLPISERDIFYDAHIVGGPAGQIILKDTIAPHHVAGADEKNIKQKYAEPIPINFIKVGPGVTFEFRFDLKDSIIKKDKEELLLTAEKKIKLFKNILMDFGIGAKTNVGYGVLDE